MKRLCKLLSSFRAVLQVIQFWKGSDSGTLVKTNIIEIARVSEQLDAHGEVALLVVQIETAQVAGETAGFLRQELFK